MTDHIEGTEIYFNHEWLMRGWVVSLVMANKLRVGAELGVLHGGLTFLLLDKKTNLTLHAVDLFERQPKHFTYSKPDYDFRNEYPLFCKRAIRYGDRLIVHKGYTHDVAKEIEDGSLDFVFIDADHDYEAVKQDIIDWRPKIRPGGFLMGHDTHLPGVEKAVKELCNNPRVSRECFCWVERLKGGEVAKDISPFNFFLKLDVDDKRQMINPDLVVKIVVRDDGMDMHLLNGEILHLSEEVSSKVGTA